MVLTWRITVTEQAKGNAFWAFGVQRYSSCQIPVFYSQTTNVEGMRILLFWFAQYYLCQVDRS